MSWYAVWCMSNAEFVIEDALCGYGIESFLPTYEETVQWSDRKKIVARPLLRGYLFVNCDGQPRREILRIAGVIDILPTALNPAPVDESEIDNLRRVLASGFAVKPCEYVTGDAVEVESGPFTGLRGIVQRTKNGTRVIVKLEILRRAVSVEIDAEELAKQKEETKAA